MEGEVVLSSLRGTQCFKDCRIWYNWIYAAAAAKCFSRVRLCDPIDDSPPGVPVPGILQARTLEWIVISVSNARM